MKIYLLLVMLVHLAMVSGRPEAEAVPEADSDAEADSEAEADAQYQYGGPGMRRSWSYSYRSGSQARPWREGAASSASASSSSSYDSTEGYEKSERTYYGNPGDVGPYGSLPAAVEGNVIPLEGEPQVGEQLSGEGYQSAGYQSSRSFSYQPSPQISYQSYQAAYQPSTAISYEPSSQISYQSSYQPSSSVSYQSSSQAAYQPSSQISYQSSSQAAYQPSSSVSYQSSSQAAYQPSTSISYQPSPPISYQPSPPISYQPSPPISYQSSALMYQRPPFYQPAATLPDSVSIPSAPLVNNQNMLFTRSYTSIPGSACMNVCRQRPVYNARPVCGTACNVRPACQLTRPMVDYAVTGNTLSCRPRPILAEQTVYSRPAYSPQPIIQEGGCGSYTGCGQTVAAVTLPEPVYSTGGQGYNPGFNQGYNPGVNQGYNPGVSQVISTDVNQGYNPGIPCLGNGCPGAQTTSTATGTAGCGAGGCVLQGAVTLPEMLPMRSAGPVSAVTLPEAVSRGEVVGNVKAAVVDEVAVA